MEVLWATRSRREDYELTYLEDYGEFCGRTLYDNTFDSKLKSIVHSTILLFLVIVRAEFNFSTKNILLGFNRSFRTTRVILLDSLLNCYKIYAIIYYFVKAV